VSEGRCPANPPQPPSTRGGRNTSKAKGGFPVPGRTGSALDRAQKGDAAPRREQAPQRGQAPFTPNTPTL